MTWVGMVQMGGDSEPRSLYRRGWTDWAVYAVITVVLFGVVASCEQETGGRGMYQGPGSSSPRYK